MSELDVPLLVRRTRLLLRAYPPAYRAHRGEEILDTLLETTRPGRGWPPAREVVSVIGGGLRARRAANLSQGVRASLRHTAVLAVAMIMAEIPTMLMSMVGARVVGDRDLGVVALQYALPSLVVALILAATWCGRRWLAVGAACVPTCCALGLDRAGYSELAGGMLPFLVVLGVLTLAVLVPLAKRAERPPVSLLWLPCVSLAVAFVEGVSRAVGWTIGARIPGTPPMDLLFSLYGITYLSLVLVLVAVCWLITDVRPLAAITLQFLLFSIVEVSLGDETGTGKTILIGGSLAIAFALVWLLRHRARTAPPTIS